MMSPLKPLPRGRFTPEYELLSPTGRRLGSPSTPSPPRKDPVPPRCWRVSRTAAHLDVSKKRIYQLVEEGRLRAVRLGPRQMRILVSSIDTLLLDRGEE